MKLSTVVAVLAVVLSGCGKKADEKKEEAPKPTGGGETPDKPGTDTPPAGGTVGVDMEKKTIKIGALNDESGPGAMAGAPLARGKRLLAKIVNAGGSKMLPDGWQIELVEKDHQYNPQKAVQDYGAIKDQVWFIGTSFGTQTTLPLRPHLERDKMVAFPAALSSVFADHELTPILGPSIKVEAMRAFDWAVEDGGGAKKVKPAIVYQRDDYGEDAHAGFQEAAKAHGVTIVAEATADPGQKDVTALITTLKGKGATHVLVATFPGTLGALIGTAAATKWTNVKWIGPTPAWSDIFFSEKSPLPSKLFGNVYHVRGLPYWGEQLPGMDVFLEGWKKFGGEIGGPPDSMVMLSYVMGVIELEIAKRAIESGDTSRAGFLKAMKSITDFNAGGLIQPVDLSKVPYVVSTRTRVLKPDFGKKAWTVVADYAEPKALSSK